MHSSRPTDMATRRKISFSGRRKQQPIVLDNSTDLKSSLLNVGAECEDERPNNWQDCYAWPPSPASGTAQLLSSSDGYDKWARHVTHRSLLKDKSKANNITDSSVVPSPLSLQNKDVVKRQTTSKKIGQAVAASTGGSLDRHDVPLDKRFVRMESGSLVNEDRSQVSCIWTELSELLPQAKAPLDKMDSSEIVTQVMKIRNSLKTASSLLVVLNKQPDLETTRLQKDYLDAIIEILRKQEVCYLIALQRTLDDQSSQDVMETYSPKSNSKSDEPTELEISESSNDDMEIPSGAAAAAASGDTEIPLNNQRPIIEDHLGHYSDIDLEELQQKLNSLNESTWTDSLVIPGMPSYSSSHGSRTSPCIKERTLPSQTFHHDPSTMEGHPMQGKAMERSERKRLSQYHDAVTARNTRQRPTAHGHNKDRCDDLLKGVGGSQSGMNASAAIDNEEELDLLEMMKERHKTKSLLIQRNQQLKELQHHHDLLTELLRQQEEHARLLELVDEKQSSLQKLRPKAKANLLNRHGSKTGDDIDDVPLDSLIKQSECNSERLKVSITPEATCLKSTSHQKNLPKDEGMRVKKDAGRQKENVRFSEDEDLIMPDLTDCLDVQNRQGRPSPRGWPPVLSLSSKSVEMFTDSNSRRQIRNAEDDNVSCVQQNEAEREYHQENFKHSEFEEEAACAAAADDHDDPNSSLALRNEPRCLKDGKSDDYLAPLYGEENIPSLNIEDLPMPTSDASENSLMKLQENMSKLMEAKQELETLRSMLRSGARETPITDVSRGSRGKERCTKTAISDSEATGGDPGLLQKLSVLKVANEKLDRLKLVMDDVRKTSDYTQHTSLDELDGMKNSKNPRQTSGMANICDFNTVERNHSHQSLDALDPQLHLFETDLFLQLMSDDKTSCRDDTSPAVPRRAVQQSAMKDAVFIRNSLPESISSCGTPRPLNSGRRTIEMSSGSARDGKLASKNSSTTNISNISCVPCLSRSADHMSMDTCLQNSATNSSQPEKNSRKPCKVIRNQHYNTSDAVRRSIVSALPRELGNNCIPDTCRYPKKGINLGKKNIAVNTEGMKQQDDGKQMLELKNISQELKILRQDIVSLTQTVNQSLASGPPVTESRSNVLDPQLLHGLNQSFQQLMADNRQLLNRFNQLRDFVLRQTARNQCEFKDLSENMFGMDKRSVEHGHKPGRSCSYHLASETDCQSHQLDETWVKQPLPEMNTKELKHKSRHSGRFLSYLENLQPSRSRDSYEARNNCFGTNCNANNSENNALTKEPLMTFQYSGKVDNRRVRATHSQTSDTSFSASGSAMDQSLNSEKLTSTMNPQFDESKETIYSEVALFISKHENRPHYLLELIKNLQKLKTNALRNQAVDAFDQIISGFLPDDQGQEPLSISIECADSFSNGIYNSHGVDSYLNREMADDKVSEEGTEFGSASCCTDPIHNEGKEQKLLKDMGTRKTMEEEEEDETEEGSNESQSFERSGGSSSLTDPDQMEQKKWMKRDTESDVEVEVTGDRKVSPSASSVEENHYLPDFKSSSSSQEEEGEHHSEAEAVTSKGDPAYYLHLDAVAEQMGFVTVEFVDPSSSGQRMNLENEKGSSDESWVKAELPEKDLVLQPSGSDTSSEIIEEIIIEDGNSECPVELTVDQLHLKLTSIPKEEIDKRMADEYQGEMSAQQILETMELDLQNELVGDPAAAKQPAATSSMFDTNESRHV